MNFGLRLVIFACVRLIVPASFTEKNILSPLNCLTSLWKISWPYLCAGSISELSILSPGSICVSLCHFHTVLTRPLPTMLSDKVRTWKEGIQGIHLSGGECGIQRGAVIFLGLLLVTSLLILFMVLLWTLIPMRTGHEEKEARTLRELLKGQLVLPRLLNHAQNCLNNVFINLSKK